MSEETITPFIGSNNLNASKTQKKNVAILIFPNVDVLDFAGPYEVFAQTRLQLQGTRNHQDEENNVPFHVFTVAKESDFEPIIAGGGLKIIPDYCFTTLATSPQHPLNNIDILIVPGGLGTRTLLINDERDIGMDTQSSC